MAKPWVILTGDVHHMSFKGKDQLFLDSSEAQLALRAAQIAFKYRLKVTYFITGKTIIEETDVVRRIAEMPNVELGGHTYYAFKPRWLYNWIFSRLMGLRNGPKIYQDWEIRKTVNAFSRKLAIQIISWRDHAYRHDRNTFPLLHKNGISVVSDDVNLNALLPIMMNDGLISLPINIMPDHDYVYHAWLTPENPVSHRHKQRYQPRIWLELIKRQIYEVLSNGGLATLLIHPACIYIVDQFEIYEELCSFLATQFETLTVSQIRALLPGLGDHAKTPN